MIRRVFDTDKLAFTELLGVPNAIRGGGVLTNERAPSCCPGMLLEIGSFSGLNFFNDSRFQKKVFALSEYLILNPESCFQTILVLGFFSDSFAIQFYGISCYNGSLESGNIVGKERILGSCITIRNSRTLVLGCRSVFLSFLAKLS